MPPLASMCRRPCIYICKHDNVTHMGYISFFDDVLATLVVQIVNPVNQLVVGYFWLVCVNRVFTFFLMFFFILLSQIQKKNET